MKYKTLLVVVFSVNLFFQGLAQVETPAPYGPVPSKNQLHWQEMEYYAFVHFSVNTYTDMAWGNGNENLRIFNPTQLDCRQWARICKQAGMKDIIITAKHHSGFCLWPSKYTEYSVKNSPWKNGKGDIVREMADACKEYGLNLGMYLSPWDRNSADYGKPAYITYFRNQLRELLTNYGDIFEIWFDGANGGSGYYGDANETRKIDRKTYYVWPGTYKLVRELQPNIVIWNDGGERADLRWVGTEGGNVGETNWSLLDSTGEVTDSMLRNGLEGGNAWVPGEVNTSIRPEWFYHPKEDSKLKTLPQLMDIYYHSIGRNATLLLNFPIMPNGLINKKDEAVSLEFAKAGKKAFAINLAKNIKLTASATRENAGAYAAAKTIDGNYKTYWCPGDGITNASLTLDFGKPVSFNRFLVQEYIPLGQRVRSFMLESFSNGTWQQVAKETTIGYKRILRFRTVKTSKLRFTIIDAKSWPLISNIEVYNARQILAPPSVMRSQSGEVQFSPADFESQFFYTLDGSEPSAKSRRYLAPFQTGQRKINIKCIAHDSITNKNSTVTEESFDIARKRWKIVGTSDINAYQVLDGNPETQWYQESKLKRPVDLIIDLGQEENISGFKYLPDQHWWGSGIITNYRFYVSRDNIAWHLVDSGEFSNIKNNPVW